MMHRQSHKLAMLTLMLSIGLLLSACSRSTLLTVQTDVLSFLSEQDRSGELSLAVDEYLLPDQEGFSAEQLGVPTLVLDALEGLTLELGAALTSNAVTGNEAVSVALHISDSAQTSAFDTSPVATETVNLEPGETKQLAFTVEVNELVNAAALANLKSGDFRLGVRLEYVAGPGASGVAYRLDAVTVALSARPGALVPF